MREFTLSLQTWKNLRLEDGGKEVDLGVLREGKPTVTGKAPSRKTCG